MSQKRHERRMLIQQELLDEAQRYLNMKRKIPIVYEDEEQRLIVLQQWTNDIPLTICEMRVDGVFPDQFIEFFQSY